MLISYTMLNLPVYLVSATVIVYIIRKCCERRWGKCTNDVKLIGKVAIVTGANSGIGYQISKELAARGAHVIVACRSLTKAEEAILSISKELSLKIDMVPMAIDLASLKSVKRFCHQFKENYTSLDLLINNAGVSYPNNERHTTEDGLEVHFGVNYLGHFYLTNMLLDKLHDSSRVVILASSLYQKGSVDLKHLNNLDPKMKTNLYANSKLECVYFCHELAKRTKGKGINVYAACPGWVYTSLFRHSLRWYHFIIVAPIALFFMRSPKQGSQTPVYCATEPKLKSESGLVYRDCKHFKTELVLQDKISVELWEKSEEIINNIVHSHEKQILNVEN